MENVLYSDLDLTFIPNPKTGDLVRKVNIEAIRRAFNNLMRLEAFDIPFRPDLRSDVRNYLFSNFDRIDIANIKKDIRDTAAIIEPRIKIKKIEHTINGEGRSATFQVFYSCESLNSEGNFSLIVERVR